ncbi:MAG: hypothetical protein KDB30_00875 [Tetrasphaera sp.]|nr:hypothetical protein [Tetrasphaera sp.]
MQTAEKQATFSARFEYQHSVGQVAEVEPAHLVKIEGFEEHIRQLPAVDLKVVHHFSKGVYARELHIPKGTVLTGHIHKFDNLNIMSQGDLSIVTESGVVRVKAPHTVVSPPGTKRLAYAHEYTIWTTIHGTHETDVSKIEDEFIAHSYEDYLAFCADKEGS